ncbi:MAG: hypothetical protein QM766_03680 [Burkholderiaceae bacterium]
MPLNAFIVRPFAVKTIEIESLELATSLTRRIGDERAKSAQKLVRNIRHVDGLDRWLADVDFDVVHQLLFKPALEVLRVQGDAANAVVVAGNIREDMFNRLVTADVVIADLSIYNPNVYYELGIRQAFRDKYTFLVRSNHSPYPFDLQTDRYFEYSLLELIDAPQAAFRRLAVALRATINSPEADSPIFKLLPQLEAEDRARFIAVPEEFREEVERAKRHRHREHLSLLAVECDGFLWGAEGLRAVARAQFDGNFLDGARWSWEQLASRYPDDIEANTILSTIYQRQSDTPRSEQALSRVARVRSLPQSKLSQLRALSGRNLKESWKADWIKLDDLGSRQKRALMSPLLQRAYDAFHAAFMADLNNSYAGLNALTLLVIQTELARLHKMEWAAIQVRPETAERALEEREQRIATLIAALELAVESERERLRLQASQDPWFDSLEAAVQCIVSTQPDRVAQLYEGVKYFAPKNAESSMRRSLEIYEKLEIQGSPGGRQRSVGCILDNVQAALRVLGPDPKQSTQARHGPRILMFVGMRVDEQVPFTDADESARNEPAKTNGRSRSARPGFPPGSVPAARAAILKAIDEEIALRDQDSGQGDILFALAAGANGGDLLFHEACRERGIRTRMCLALPRAPYVGRYVAPAGTEWVERFRAVHRQVKSQSDQFGSPVVYFTDTAEMPRWLHGKPYYNVGRRNNLWMLQHAISAASDLGDDTEITLLALWDEESSEGSFGGIGDIVRSASAYGIKVHKIPIPKPGDQGSGPGGMSSGGVNPEPVRSDRGVLERAVHSG